MAVLSRSLAICFLAVFAMTTTAFAADPAATAQAYVRTHHEALGLTAADVSSLIVSDNYTSAHNGVSHVYLQQHLNGIRVFNGLLNVNVSASDEVLSAGNRFVSNLAANVNATAPTISAADAVALAAAHLGLAAPILVLKEAIGGSSQKVVYTGSGISRRDIAVELMYLNVGNGKARLVWDLNLEPSTLHYWQMSIDATDGAVLAKRDMVKNDSYRAYAPPAESPNHVAGPDGRSLLTEALADALASPFGWHDTDGAPGADTIDLTGNNVAAQTDLDADNLYSPEFGDVRPSDANRIFDFPLDLTGAPSTYRAAVVTNLFVWNNLMHDIHYRYGFTEAAGNFQLNNYGKGGLQADAVQADAQDGSGTNNANMLTLSDGIEGRMQMYVWTSGPSLVVNTPDAIAGTYRAAPADFGAEIDATGVSGDLEKVTDINGTSRGCGGLVGFTPGKIALIDRGGCEFGEKARHAETAGAIAVVIVNNVDGPPVPMGPGNLGGTVTIPAVMVAKATGDQIKPQLANGEVVNVSMRKVTPDRDSDVDNGVIAHEYGHGVSVRLTGGPANPFCLENDQQGGEGWSDFWALALTQQPGKNGTEPRGIGTYVMFEDDPATARGIRPYPYSTDMKVDPQTFGHLNNPSLPAPHGVGSVWATMLWEMYWAIVNGVPELGLPGAGYRQNVTDMTAPLAGNQIALQLVMDGLKLQPCEPTFVDARDAILKADQINYGGTYHCYIWWAFAKRGLGVNADPGIRIVDERTVTEDFSMPSSCNYIPVAVDDAATVSEDGAVTIAVLANDSDREGSQLQVTSVTQPRNGSATRNADNTVTYTPAANFNGSDSFTYTATDLRGGSATATVTVTVTPVNDAPVAVADSASTAKNNSVTIAVLANDTDVDGDRLSVASVGGASNGTVVRNANGTVTYSPRNGFSGSDSFSYTASDASGATSSATVSVTVGK